MRLGRESLHSKYPGLKKKALKKKNLTPRKSIWPQWWRVRNGRGAALWEEQSCTAKPLGQSCWMVKLESIRFSAVDHGGPEVLPLQEPVTKLLLWVAGWRVALVRVWLLLALRLLVNLNYEKGSQIDWEQLPISYMFPNTLHSSWHTYILSLNWCMTLGKIFHLCEPHFFC